MTLSRHHASIAPKSSGEGADVLARCVIDEPLVKHII